MNEESTMTRIEARGLPQKLSGVLRLLGHIPHDLIALVSRISIGAVFWQSGQTKLDGWRVSDNAVYLFQTEYRLPFIDPWLAAHLAAFAEHLFPALLIMGFASRLSALALLGMTLVIEIFVYPDAWPTHGTWAVCFLVIIAGGPGRISIDHFIARHFARTA
ncbi:putative oxidoreductase [Rhizobium azibense]|uniref:Putative oxidoreductase n=2 Tax=Rhizobium azibense TaxID=1136135 RepID=A0A4R3RRQ5_9HYPH|nr:putative oxidoreductase [Rhizobium azibense]TCU38710.1 putative oxidoreductase [Rhizobium azibense]